jgi:hypothetical protein
VDPEVPGSSPGGGTIDVGGVSAQRERAAMARQTRRGVRFAVGISGHRLNQLPADTHAPLQAALGYVLAACRAAAEEAHAGPVQPVMVTALAEGADRFAAAAAAARRWRIEVPLPFEPARYTEDFGNDASRADFAAWLKRAKRVEVTSDAALPGAAPYAGAGRMTVEWSDVLVALWNGLAPKGPGGTAEVSALMLATGRPVLWIPSQTAGPISLIAGPNTPLWTALARRFAIVDRPQTMRVA